MEDLYMKFGIVIVAVAVVVLLIAFSFRVVDRQNFPEERIQSIRGDSNYVYLRLSKLCNLCVSKSYSNRECFLVELNITEGNITEIPNAVFTNFEVLTKGAYDIKLYNNETKCNLRILS